MRTPLDGVVAGGKVDGVLLGAVPEVVQVIPRHRLDAIIDQAAVGALPCSQHTLCALTCWPSAGAC